VFKHPGGIFLPKKVRDLTPAQKKVLDFIKLFIKVRGFAPCLQEIAIGLQMRSRSNIHRLVAELRDKGYLSTKPLLARTIKVKDERPAE
jgi:repressor LexA